MTGLHAALEEIAADVPVYGDLDRAIDQAERERRRHNGVVGGLTAAAAVVAVVVGVLATTPGRDDSQPPLDPVPTPTSATPTPTETTETIPLGPSEVLTVRQAGRGRLEVTGETVPGRWGVNDSRRDVWVAMRTADNGYESQWWGKGGTAHAMPPSMGLVLRGGVVISEDARWIVWTRPSADVYGKNPPRVMEVVDTATGKVRWSRKADADAVEMGALAVTNDGVVVFGHCLEPVFDSGGWPQCDDARVDVWAPEAGVIGRVPAEVSVRNSPFADTVAVLNPLVERTGAHNGLLVREARKARPQYVRVSDRGEVEVVATLPRRTLAVTADERFGLITERCPDGLLGCGFAVLPLGGSAPNPVPSLAEIVNPQMGPYYRYVVERDDMVLVVEPDSGDAVARCALAQARCVPITR